MKKNCDHGLTTKLSFLRIATPWDSRDDRHEVWLVKCLKCEQLFETPVHRPGTVLDLRLLNDCLKGLRWGMVSIFSGRCGTYIPEQGTSEFDMLEKLRQSPFWKARYEPDIRLDRSLVFVREFKEGGEHKVIGVFTLDARGFSENMVNIF